MKLKILTTLLLTTLLAHGAWAQERAPHSATGGRESSSPLYQSAFADYQGFREPVATSWRAANDQVRDAGAMGAHDMSSMAGKANMSGDGMAATGKAGMSPGHDMGNMNRATEGAPAAQPHDMSKMAPSIESPRASGSKPAATGAKTKKQADMPGHDMANMADMPGMARDGKRAPPAKPAPAAATKQPVTTGEKMDHSKMKMNKE